jgi:hypothetical protein
MLVGWRESHQRLNALRVKLHQEVYRDLAELCRPAVSRIQDYKERPYENFAALDDQEYFWYEHMKLPKRPPSRKSDEGDSEAATEDETADLVRLVKSVDALVEATRDELGESGYSFYAICWPHRRAKIGFVSRLNPMSTLRPGYRYFRYGDAMNSVEHPDFALREGADLVVGSEGTAILTNFAFESLLGDVGVTFQDVKRDMALLRRALSKSIKLTVKAEHALQAEASRTRTNAKRLRLLPERLKLITLTPRKLRMSLAAHKINPALVLDNNNEFSFDQKGVEVFLDAIEGRYFEDDLGGEKRRADRYSKR